MEGGDRSVAVQHRSPGSASRLGFGLSPGQQSSNAFTAKGSYFSPPNPVTRQAPPAFSPVANTPIAPPPSINRTPPSPTSVIPPTTATPAAPRPVNPTPPPPPTPPALPSPLVQPLAPQQPGTGGGGTPTTGTGGGGTPTVGAVGRGMNNDGRLHPMLPNDLEQLLTSGDQIAQQNATLYARHGIPMPGGTQFGNPNDPTSFAYMGAS